MTDAPKCPECGRPLHGCRPLGAAVLTCWHKACRVQWVSVVTPNGYVSMRVASHVAKRITLHDLVALFDGHSDAA